MTDIHFKIIIPFYNVEKWIKYPLKTVLLQEYKNFECILVNDISTDNTIAIAKEVIKDDKRFKILNKDKKTGAIGSIYEGIKFSNPSDEDVIVILDGDDWFYNEKVLSILNKKYIDSDCLMTYGSYVEYPSGKKGQFAKQVPKEVIDKNLYRESPWMTSHLRSCKYKIWKNVNPGDLKNSNGEFYPMAGGLAMMFPLLEMSGDRALFISDPLIVYNRSNPMNEDKVNHALQMSIEHEIRSKVKYNKI